MCPLYGEGEQDKKKFLFLFLNLDMVLDTTPDLTSCKLLNTNSDNGSKLFNVYLNGTENGSNQTEDSIKCH